MKRVFALIQSVGFERLEREVGEELLLGVDDHGFDGTGGQTAHPQALEVLHAADVHQSADDLVAELLLHVWHQRRGVQATRVREDAAFLLHQFQPPSSVRYA